MRGNDVAFYPLGRAMDESFDPYHKWLGIHTTQRPLNYYQLLGLPLFESDDETIRHAADQRIVYVRTLAVNEYVDLSQHLLNELAAAKVCLLDAAKRAAYDVSLRQSPRTVVPPPVAVMATVPAAAPVSAMTIVDPPPLVLRTRSRGRAPSSGSKWAFVGVGILAVVCLAGIFLYTASSSGPRELASAPPPITIRGKVTKQSKSSQRPPSPSPPFADSDQPAPSLPHEPAPTQPNNVQEDDAMVGEDDAERGNGDSAKPAANADGQSLDDEDAPGGDTEGAMPAPSLPPADEAPNRIQLLPIADKIAYMDEDDVIAVRVDRGGYQGPIQLRLDGLPPNAAARESFLPPGQSRALLEFSMPVAGKPSDFDARVIAPFDDQTVEEDFRLSVRRRPKPQPLVVPLEGFGKQTSLRPITFGPDWLGFNKALSPAAWQTPGVFARLQTKACLGYPTIPVSTYVLEMELELVHPDAGMRICLGDPWNAIQLSIYRNKDRNKIEATLANWRNGGWGWSGHRDLETGERLPLKWIVLDGRHTLCLKNKPILVENNAWPADLTLRIWSESPGSAVIHRCSCRALREEDVQLLGLPMPLAHLKLDPAAAKDRIEQLRGRQRSQPVKGKGYLAGRTRTPMAWIPPGEYLRASSDPQAFDQHRVSITRGFWIGRLEVTQEEWNALMPANPSRVQGSPYLPVDWVTWQDAALFCDKLTQREAKSRRLLQGYEYRLPTDAEWEYACRAGSESDFSVPQAEVWCREQSDGCPHEVGQMPANAWGLFDMHGNAMEWCLDAWYDYPKDPAAVLVDPYKQGRVDQDAFVVRGGAWWMVANYCRSPWRERDRSSPAAAYRGFRFVLAPTLFATMK